MLCWSRRAAFLLLPACSHPNDHPACGPHGECPSGLTCSAALVCESGGDGSVCFGENIRTCFPASAIPTIPRMLLSTDIDTDMTASSSLCNQDNDQKDRYCVVAGAGLTLAAGATLTARGAKPLVLLSTTTMDLLGDIDVGSYHTGGQRRGAGANPTGAIACAFGPLPTAAMMSGGGAGGSNGTGGGGGGNSGSGAGGGMAGSRLLAFLGVLHGGCKGGDGSANIGSPAAGGDGGGAVALIAAMQIRVDAAINASGGGGLGGAAGAANGGGGGGSGGMIVFDSPVSVMFGANAKLWANGGGGGQGGSPTADGASGGESSDPMTSASSTSVAGAGGSGADGAVGVDLGGRGGNAAVGGGGGGGGGVGFIIHAPGLADPALISPPSSNPYTDP